MNPSFFGKNILLIFSGSIWARDNFNTNFASSFQGLSDGQLKFSPRQNQQLKLDKTLVLAIYLTDNKTFAQKVNKDG